VTPDPSVTQNGTISGCRHSFLLSAAFILAGAATGDDMVGTLRRGGAHSLLSKEANSVLS
jgi:hypothetical protein